MSATGFEWLPDVSCLQAACEQLTGTVRQNAAVACRRLPIRSKHARTSKYVLSTERLPCVAVPVAVFTMDYIVR